MNDIEQSLYELVSGAAEPALGIAGGRIMVANAPAQEKLGPVEGRSALSVLPALVLGREAGSYCASFDLGGERVAARFSRLGDATLCRLSFSRPRTEMSRRAGLEHALRASLADLRLAVDRICALSAGRGGDGELALGAASLSHGYFRMARTVVNAVTLEAVCSGSAAFAPQELDMSELVRELAWTVDFFARGRGVTVEYESRPEPLYMSADRTLVEQMLLNLLSNSLLSLPDGGHVRLSLARRGEWAVISVDDDGCGIAPGRFADIEDGEGSLSAPPGLGLPLARSIAELHGGALVLESRPGRGTSARVTLPLGVRSGRGGSTRLSGGGAPYRSGGMDMVLTQLSTWLHSSDYDSRLSGE